MLRFQRAILLELASVFALALVVVTGVLFATMTLQNLGKFQSVELVHLFEVVPWFLPLALAYATPYAFLLSVSLAYGRMVADRELVALRINGVHPGAAAAPALAMGAVLSLLALVTNGWVLPDAQASVRTSARNLREIILASMSGRECSVSVRGCRMSYLVYVPAKRGEALGTFVEFELDSRVRGTGDLLFKLIAERARLRQVGDDLEIDTDNAFLLTEDPATGKAQVVAAPPMRLAAAEKLRLGSDLEEIAGFEGWRLKQRDFALPDLVYAAERGSLEDLPARRILVELHARLAQALAPLLFGLVAVGVALNLRSGGRRLVPFLLAFLPVVLVHFPLLVAGKALADGERVPAWAGLWAGDAALLVGGLLLLRKAYAR